MFEICLNISNVKCDNEIKFKKTLAKEHKRIFNFLKKKRVTGGDRRWKRNVYETIGLIYMARFFRHKNCASHDGCCR